MRHVTLGNRQRTYASAILGACILTLCSLAAADTPDEQTLQTPHPFQAQYRLEIRGWPSATITHTLSNEGQHWLSSMNFAVAVARGEERSRFSIDDATTHSLLYNSSYSLLGVGDSYQLNESDISSLDRQAALFDLSRRAGREGCTESAPCDIEFVDHRGRDEHFQYYVDQQTVNGSTTISVPAGEFETTRVTLIDKEKPDRHLQINFHPDWPGLILTAEYQKEGRRQTSLTLTHFNPAGDSAP
ncbi:hypothetical protein [Halomonas alkaliantarctica]|uniref:hypothetical protein n=1 Tax=Halomonas alkaliantarctica TaxID=232346 RepID=UPI002658574A|nr:hypothetical protein [Halomonas alkaliantarctica]